MLGFRLRRFYSHSLILENSILWINIGMLNYEWLFKYFSNKVAAFSAEVSKVVFSSSNVHNIYWIQCGQLFLFFCFLTAWKRSVILLAAFIIDFRSSKLRWDSVHNKQLETRVPWCWSVRLKAWLRFSKFLD